MVVMTTTIDHIAPAESSLDPVLGTVDGPTRAELNGLEARLDRQARSSTAWTLTTCAVAAVAVLFSLIAIGWGSRAINESKSNVHRAMMQTAPMAPMTSVATTPVPSATAVAVSPVAVRLDDFQVLPAAPAIAAGSVTLQITNTGKVAHERLVFRTDLAPAALPLKDGNLDEEAVSGLTKVSDGENLEPGATEDRTVDLTQAGAYLFVCNLPGHFKAGMYAIITVK